MIICIVLSENINRYTTHRASLNLSIRKRVPQITARAAAALEDAISNETYDMCSVDAYFCA